MSSWTLLSDACIIGERACPADDFAHLFFVRIPGGKPCAAQVPAVNGDIQNHLETQCKTRETDETSSLPIERSQAKPLAQNR
jgi:hypothetical protein